MAALLALLAPGLLIFAAHVRRVLPAFHELDYTEGQTMSQYAGFVDGQFMAPLTEYPYIAYEFPPVYYLAVWAMNLLVPDPLLAGRLVSALAAVAASGIAGWLTWSGTEGSSSRVRAASAAVSALMLFAFFPVHQWGVSMRIDTLGTTLGAAGLAFAWAAYRRSWMVLPAALCFVLAVFTKQSLVASAAATWGLMLLLRPRLAAAGIGACVGLGLAGLGSLYALWGAESFRHLFVYPMNRMDWDYGFSKVQPMLTFHGIVLAFVALQLGVELFRARGLPSLRRLRETLERDPEARGLALATLYLGCNALSLYMVFKLGSSFNYFLEACFAVSWGVGLWVARRSGGSAIERAPVVLLLFQAALALPLNVANNSRAVGDPSELDAVYRRVEAAQGEVFSEDMNLLVRAGKTVPWESFVIAELAASGKLDEGPMVEHFEEHTFDLVVLYSRPSRIYDLRFTPAMQDAIERCYALDERIGSYEILAPRPCAPPG